jgi:hemolysin III
MDFVPTALLAAAVSMYFWHRQGVSWWWVPLLVFGPYVFVMAGMSFLGMADAMRPFAGYTVWAISISLPVARYLKWNGWVDWWLVVGAAASFMIAVSLRTIDGGALVEILPMGTHWLWHSFGATAV